ncbi:MAG: hypothetical protein Q9P01_08945 [Anaerolineae bacterium]|nr:hypothetical protein [Anaerolineae bacterium]
MKSNMISLLREGFEANPLPEQPPPQKRGRTKQSQSKEFAGSPYKSTKLKL